MVPTGTRKTGKPRKMERHFPVWEKSREFHQDWKNQGKVREFYPKYWKIRKNYAGKLK